MNRHQDNTHTWQSYVAMYVEMECLKKGFFPNGQKLKQADIDECHRRIEAHTELLNSYDCELPILTDEEGDQIALFTNKQI